MFQSFPTITAPAVPSAPPPLVNSMKPNVSSIRGKNKSNDDSSDSLFDTKANNTIFDDNDKPLTHTYIYETGHPLILLHDRGFISFTTGFFNLKSLRSAIFSPFLC